MMKLIYTVSTIEYSLKRELFDGKEIYNPTDRRGIYGHAMDVDVSTFLRVVDAFNYLAEAIDDYEQSGWKMVVRKDNGNSLTSLVTVVMSKNSELLNDEVIVRYYTMHSSYVNE